MRELTTAAGLACPDGSETDTAILDCLADIKEALENLDVTIDGDVTVDGKLDQWLQGCRNWCDPVSFCLSAEGDVVRWRDDAGVVADGDPGGISMNACPAPVKDELAVYATDDEGCTVFLRLVTVLCFGPLRVVMVDGVKTPDVATLGAGEFFGPTDMQVGPCAKCVPCPVDPKDAYDPGEVASLIVTVPFDPDCGDPDVPTTVTWGDVTTTVTPDLPWCMPVVDCETNTKPIVITGPHVQTKLWTYELLEEGC